MESLAKEIDDLVKENKSTIDPIQLISEIEKNSEILKEALLNE